MRKENIIEVTEITNRDRIDIIRMILLALPTEKKTRIMYKAFISAAQLKEYIDYLFKHQLIYKSYDDGFFKLTRNGEDYLSTVNELAKLIELK